MGRRLRRRCQSAFHRLQLPASVASIEDVVSHIASSRGRPIHLRAISMESAGVSGAWLPTSTADHIFYDADTSARHQLQIIGHELGHLVSAHEGSPQPGKHQLPLDVADAAQIMLSRATYTSEQEQIAEQLGDLFVRHLDVAAASAAGGVIGVTLRPPRNRADL